MQSSNQTVPAGRGPINFDAILVYAFLGAGLGAGLYLRWSLALMSESAGHGDSAFYLTVARNILLGRGLVIDYVWHFMNGASAITHYSNDFWHPLTSYALAVPMRLFGGSLLSARLAPIIASLGIAIVAFFLGRDYFASERYGAIVAVLTFFAPSQIIFSAATDSIAFFGFFGVMVFFLAMKGRSQPAYFLCAAAFSGLAELTRQDGIIVFLGLLVAIILAPLAWRQKLLVGLGAAAIQITVLSPLLIKNYSIFHAPFPHGPSTMMFLTQYEDAFAYGKDFTLQSYISGMGYHGIWRQKLDALRDNFVYLTFYTGPIFLPAAAVGLLDLLLIRRDRQKLEKMLPVLIFGLGVYVFYTLLASFMPATPKSLMILVPFLWLIIMDIVLARSALRLWAYAFAIMASLLMGLFAFNVASSSTLYYNRLYVKYAQMGDMIRADAAGRNLAADEIVVMTRNPWDLFEATGMKGVMIPNNDLETILAIAAHYHATYLVLPAPRQALIKIYNGKSTDPRLEQIGRIDFDQDIEVYRLDLQP